jgi:hypothetical protein
VNREVSHEEGNKPAVSKLHLPAPRAKTRKPGPSYSCRRRGPGRGRIDWDRQVPSGEHPAHLPDDTLPNQYRRGRAQIQAEV